MRRLFALGLTLALCLALPASAGITQAPAPGGASTPTCGDGWPWTTVWKAADFQRQNTLGASDGEVTNGATYESLCINDETLSNCAQVHIQSSWESDCATEVPNGGVRGLLVDVPAADAIYGFRMTMYPTDMVTGARVAGNPTLGTARVVVGWMEGQEADITTDPAVDPGNEHQGVGRYHGGSSLGSPSGTTYWFAHGLPAGTDGWGYYTFGNSGSGPNDAEQWDDGPSWDIVMQRTGSTTVRFFVSNGGRHGLWQWNDYTVPAGAARVYLRLHWNLAGSNWIGIKMRAGILGALPDIAWMP